MSKFVLRENSGNLFKNTDTDHDTDRDYRGELNVEGREFWVSDWVKNGKKGKFLSLAVKLKEQARRTGPGGARSSLKDGLEDEIPF